MRRTTSFCTWFGALLVSTACVSPSRGEDVLWLSDLEVGSKLLGKEIVVEGRFQGRVGANLDQLRLKNVSPDKCEFRLAAEAERRFPSNMQFIRLAGTLSLNGTKLLMRVDSWWKINATDEDRYQDVASRLAASDSKAWYELADRTRRLAQLHDDDALAKLADSARIQGFRAEEAALKPAQFDILLQLADRAADLGLDSEESRRMRHKSLRWQLDHAAPDMTTEQWTQLADKIARLLPGARVPLKSIDSAILTQYRKQPIDTYESTAQLRDLCDREFWITVATRSLTSAAKAPQADLVQLASDARRLIPEQPETARQLLRQWAELESARIPTLPPASQVRRLAETYRTQLGDPNQARLVLRQWLDARRQAIGARDADGRVRLAKDYRSDLNDDETAAKILLEAVAIESDLHDAVDSLKSLGYVLGPNGWARSGSSAAPDASAARRRLPEVGMTAEQVRQVLGDPRPSGKIRYTDLSADRRRVVVEKWTYFGPPDVHVVFHVATNGDTKVIGITTQLQK